MKRLTFVLWLALAAVLAACGGAAPEEMPALELTLTATDIAYDVNRLEVKAGQTVKLTLHNAGALEHDFSIMEMPHTGEVVAEEMEDAAHGHEMTLDPEVHVAAPIGDSRRLEFTPSKPGEYEFFCTVEGHKEAGMTGVLVVTAP
ncbi:MAG: hypothetical protein Fur0021_32490 [Candidatus Promineifilaceae bacterium]